MAKGQVQWQWFINIVTGEVEHIQAHTNSGDDPTIAPQVLQVADKDQLKKNYRIDGLLAFGAIVQFCFLIQFLYTSNILLMIS